MIKAMLYTLTFVQLVIVVLAGEGKTGPKSTWLQDDKVFYPHRVKVTLKKGLSVERKKEVLAALEKKFPGLYCINFDKRWDKQTVRLPKGMTPDEAIKKFVFEEGVEAAARVQMHMDATHGAVLMIMFKEGTTAAQRKETVALIKGATVQTELKNLGICVVKLPDKVKTADAVGTYMNAPHVYDVEPDRAM